MNKREPAYYPSGADLQAFSNMQEAICKFDAIIESSYDGFYITDGAANTIMINKSYEVISGLTKAEVIGRNMRDLVDEGAISSSGTLLAIKLREAVTLEQEFKTGKKAIITSTPIFDENNDIIMVVTNVRDMTEIYDLKRQLVENVELTQKYYSEIEIIRRQVIGSGDIIAKDGKTLNMLRMVNKVAQLDTTVILLGETGVGKEKIATYIYKQSKRNEERFIKVNCGAIPEALIESELFGYEPGSFTGASREGKMGLFEIADKGTIFLDEVGELPLEMQVKLLRVLQEQEVERIGGKGPVKIDVRILAATNRNLEEMVGQKRFREDLYYRLNVFPVVIPPLRERKDDILPLSESMLAELNKKYKLKKQLTQSAVMELMQYRWPGNVRELRNVIERAIIMSAGDSITINDLAIRANDVGTCPCSEDSEQESIQLKAIVQGVELSYINRAYEKYRNVRDAARSLGIDPATFVRKRRKFSLDGSLQK
jgi:PAS domain S-box-containing protein